MGIFGSKRKKKHTCRDSYEIGRPRKVKKPVLYLYPEEITDVEIKLTLKIANLLAYIPNLMNLKILGKSKHTQMEKYQSWIKNIHIFSGKLIPMLHKI